MRVIQVKNYDEMSLKAAHIIRAQVELKPDCVLGFATGSTPLGTYANLVKWCKEDGLDFSQVKSVNLDEYKGLPKDHDQSYAYFMDKNLFSQINIDKANTYLPDGMCVDGDAECKRYDELIKSLGGADLQLLGIGNNGHIGFNEPADCFQNGTYCVELTESTIEANSRLFEKKEDVPRFAFSMGSGTIMSAKRVLLIANGKAKAEAIKGLMAGPITPGCPASILQMHPDCTVIVDDEAMSLVTG